MFANFLNQYRTLPVSHIFRAASEAEEYAESIKLGDGQRIVGGMAADSVGKLWWVGVEVEDIARWGNPSAVNKHAE